ncbi:hypothetical protein BDV26DRAFT_295184 [Aspergillus bertholletiae]|uniref:Carrier domain-containing protein n=1 Tax=Aspergillus bertholletiae TaxID=1226010 RepID=A0A5N7B1P1_9EURO|nr:hypothetical protein BDV26DRAFT_295184 [Aspergillus bertholletiae]
MSSRHDLTSALQDVEPCIFPRLRSDWVKSPVHEKHSSWVSLPNISSWSSTPTLSGNDWCTLAFALLLSAYIRTDRITFGILSSSKLNTAGKFELSPAHLVRAVLDASASISDNFRNMTSTPLSGSDGEMVGSHIRELDDKARSKCIGTTLCLSDFSPNEQPCSNPFNSDIVLEIQGCHPDAATNQARITLHYRTDLLDNWYAQNVVATFQSIVCAISTGIDGLLQDVSLISASDRQTIEKWNANLPPPAHQTLNEHFEKVFKNNFDKEAVYTTAGCFTYGELDDLSTVLAGRLMKVGVKRNTTVPICMNKSRWGTCAMTAVWKAGGAVTTMDPSYPDDRLVAIVEEVGARIVISDPSNAARFEKAGLYTISDLENLPRLLEADGLPIDRASAWRIGGVEPDDLAFVAFTSGSTGRPKGVMHTHNRLTSEHQSYIWNSEYTDGARILQFGSYAFIAGVGDNFRALLHGATLCVPSESERTSSLAEFINRSRSTRSYMTPSIVRTLNPKDVPSLKYLCVGGEPVGPDLEKTWRGHVRFIQLYGASEGGFMIKDPSNPSSNGRGLYPVGGLSWLVDPQDVNKLVPIGALGEIVFESHELAIGYMNDPEKTAKTFIDPPTWALKRADSMGCRYLRMGDLGKYEPDGSLLIYGRIDAQIKINGQRVEPGDIESKLRSILPPRSEAIVDLVKPIDAPERPILTAFIRLGRESVSTADAATSCPDSQTIISNARKQLETTLPRHMIPRAFIIVKQFPQGHKIDRKTLRADASELGYKRLLASSLPTDNRLLVRPVDEKEQILAELWAKVLKQDVENIGRNSDFWELGGDSLTAIRLVAAAREKSLVLTTQGVLTSPILENMAQLAKVASSEVESAVVSDKITPDLISSEDPITQKATDFQEWAACVGALNGGWVDHFVYDFRGRLDVQRLEQSCRDLVGAHPILRVVFERLHDEIYMRIPHEQALPFKLQEVAADEIESKSTEIYAEGRVSPLGCPIARFTLIKGSSHRHRLILRVSHAQYDGFCAHTFGQHLRLLYLSQPIPRSLPFHEYARRVQDPCLMRNAEMYWRDHLEDSRMPKLVRRSQPGLAFNKTLNCEFRKSISEPNLRHVGLSVATIVHTAWALTISSLSGSSDVVFGDFIAGRQLDIPGIETVVGPCVNFIPRRVRLWPNLTNIEILRKVQADVISAIPHESLGFKNIIQKCTDWGQNERFSSIVNFVNVENASFGVETWLDTDDNRLEVDSIYEEQQHDKTDLWLLCLPGHLVAKSDSETNAGSKTLELHLRYSTSVYQASAIDRISDLFCEALDSLTALDMPIAIPCISSEERVFLVPSSD